MATGLSPNPAEIGVAFGLEPAAAVEHLQSKGLKVTGGWRTVSEAAHAQAFTVANVTKLDVLKDIQDELLRAQKDGLTMAQFRTNLQPMLERKGWFAPKGAPVRVPDGTPADPATGELPTRKRLTARRLETIFQTNMQSSMMAGRYRELKGNVENRPFFEYVAVMDGKTRPAHRAMNGRVFRHDDAGWAVWWPPCGFRCRCRVRAHDQSDLDAKGLKVESSAGRLRSTEVAQPDGTVTRVTRYVPADGGASFAPDPGFNGNPARLQAADRLLALRAPQVLPPAQAAAVVRDTFTDPKRLKAVDGFVQTVREAGQPVGARIGLGALDDAAVLKLVDEGVTFDQAAPVTLADDLVARKADLAPELWTDAVHAVNRGALYWDAKVRALVYLLGLGDGRDVRVAVRAGRVANEVIGVREQLPAEQPVLELVRKGIVR